MGHESSESECEYQTKKVSKNRKRKRIYNVFWSQHDDELLLKLMKYNLNGDNHRTPKDFRRIYTKFNKRADCKERTVEALLRHFRRLMKQNKKEDDFIDLCVHQRQVMSIW